MGEVATKLGITPGMLTVTVTATHYVELVSSPRGDGSPPRG